MNPDSNERCAVCGGRASGCRVLGHRPESDRHVLWHPDDLDSQPPAPVGPQVAPYSAPFTTDVPQCCGDPETCNDPCTPSVGRKKGCEMNDVVAFVQVAALVCGAICLSFAFGWQAGVGAALLVAFHKGSQ